jgi:hypothetical protein
MNTVGGYGDWAGKGALLIAALLAFGLVRGTGWTKAQNYLAGTAAVLYLISRLD